MAENSGSSAPLAFIVGGLLVLVLVIVGVMSFGGGNLFGGGQTKSIDVNISAPKTP